MQNREDNLQFYQDKCRELESQVRDLKQQIRHLNAAGTVNAEKPRVQEITATQGASADSTSGKRLETPTDADALQIQLLKTLAHDRSVRLRDLNQRLESHHLRSRTLENHDAVPTGSSRQDVESLEQLLDSLEERKQRLYTTIRSLQTDKLLSLNTINSLKTNHQVLEETVRQMREKNRAFAQSTEKLEKEAQSLRSRVNQLKDSKSYRAGKVLVESTKSLRSFIKAPFILNRIRKK